MKQLPLDGGTPATIASGQADPAGIAVDATNVYWTNNASGNGAGTVMKVPLGGGSPTALASGQSNPWGLAVDAVSAYWVNIGITSTVMKDEGTVGRRQYDDTCVGAGADPPWHRGRCHERLLGQRRCWRDEAHAEMSGLAG